MNIPSPPNAILLATDLGARSDRAQARAVQLARQWQARLVVLVALADGGEFGAPNSHVESDADAAAPESRAQYAERIARRDLGDAGVAVEVRVVTGSPGPAAQAAIAETGCGLCVVGTARSDITMRMDPGSTVRWLIQHASVPVLVVHERTQDAYARITVATDLSDHAARALALAEGWFPDAVERRLLHAYDVPLTTMALGDEARTAAMAHAGEEAARRVHAHLAQGLADASRWQSDAWLGGPVRQLREHARRHATELTVIASHGRSALRDRLLGSVARRLVETAVTDVLLVRGDTGR